MTLPAVYVLAFEEGVARVRVGDLVVDLEVRRSGLDVRLVLPAGCVAYDLATGRAIEAAVMRQLSARGDLQVGGEEDDEEAPAMRATRTRSAVAGVAPIEAERRVLAVVVAAAAPLTSDAIKAAAQLGSEPLSRALRQLVGRGELTYTGRGTSTDPRQYVAPGTTSRDPAAS